MKLERRIFKIERVNLNFGLGSKIDRIRPLPYYKQIFHNNLFQKSHLYLSPWSPYMFSSREHIYSLYTCNQARFPALRSNRRYKS